jgi:hypothetical protein
MKLLTFSHGPAKSASTMKMLLKLILNILLRPQKSSDLALENLALRQQLAILKRPKKRIQIRTKDRLFWIMLYRTHYGLRKDTPFERPVQPRPSKSAKVIELPRVGGLHHRYEWKEAA